MKLQDIIFLIIFLLVVLKRNSRLSTLVGIICLLLSIPLFTAWIFFTAQHLVWYSVAFFLLSIILLLKNDKAKDKS
jgi:glycerol-3-phosphate acyltransferase PlsY